jgi:hypothetical protein
MAADWWGEAPERSIRFHSAPDLSRPFVNQADRRAEPLVPGCAMIQWASVSDPPEPEQDHGTYGSARVLVLPTISPHKSGPLRKAPERSGASPHQSGRIAPSEDWPKIPLAVSCLRHGRPTWNLSSPIFGEVVEDDRTALRWIHFYHAARLGTGRYYETT